MLQAGGRPPIIPQWGMRNSQFTLHPPQGGHGGTKRIVVMKKIYISPEATIIQLAQTQPVLVGASEVTDDEIVNPGITVGDGDTFVKRGRAGSVWDDDWSQ